MIESLGERVLDTCRYAVDAAMPLAVSALEIATLDLDADDPVLGMGDDEVDLPVLGARARVTPHPADRVKHLPLVAEPVAQRVEDLDLAEALDVVLEQGPWIGPRHTELIAHR